MIFIVILKKKADFSALFFKYIIDPASFHINYNHLTINN